MTNPPFRQALVVGRFHPFHNGHQLLIDTAARIATHVFVVVATEHGQAPSGIRRTNAIREHYRGDGHVSVREFPDDGSVDPEVWAANCRKVFGSPSAGIHFEPDVVVTAEDYGEPFAKAMGAACVTVDKARMKVPISGTLIRSNPLKYWDFLPLETRKYYRPLVKRICIVGPESTGTTTLALALAEELKAAYVPEYGRDYHEERGIEHEWTESDFVHIASVQNEDEDRAALESPIVVCDTDSFATELWHERYMGKASSLVGSQSAGRQYTLYVLTGLDIPFEQDGFREEGPHREAMYERFREELIKRQKPFIEVSGSRERRLKDTLNALRPMLGELTP